MGGQMKKFLGSLSLVMTSLPATEL